MEKSLTGEQESLKESIIGAEVFDRQLGYDPKSEPIVRTEARRLRMKIEQYYKTAGRESKLRISIPKGGYGAQFTVIEAHPVPGRLELVARAGAGGAMQSTDRSAAARAPLLELVPEAESMPASEVRKPVPLPFPVPPLKRKIAVSPRIYTIGAAALALCAALAFAWSLRHHPVPPLRVVPLTTLPYDEYFASFSPDGSEVVFSWGGEGEDNIDLYVKRVDGVGIHRLTTDPARDEYSAWSPSGNWIAFIRALHDVMIVSPRGGEERKIAETTTFSEALAWTPDGSSVIVPAYREGSGDLFDLDAVNVSTGARTRINQPDDPVCAVQPFGYSPDGKLFGFARRPQVGAELELFVRPAEGGRSRRVTYLNRAIEGWTWTPDSKEMVFSSNRNGPFTLWRVRVRDAGAEPEIVAGIGNDALYPVMARFAPGHSGSGPAELVFEQWERVLNLSEREIRINASGAPIGLGPERRLFPSTRDDSSPRFSPDGTQMVFISTRSGSEEVWVGTPATGKLRKLTDFAATHLYPRFAGWSPDGRSVLFAARTNRAERFEHTISDLYSVPAAGGALRRLTDWNSEGIWPWWSRDGKWIYLTSNRSGRYEIWKFPAGQGGIDKGSDAVQITHSGGFASIESPDGRRIFIEKGALDQAIWSMPAGGDDSAARPFLTGVSLGAWWMPGARGFYYVDAAKSGVAAHPETDPKPIYFADWQSGAAHRIGDIDHRFLTGRPDFAVSPDGRILVYSHFIQKNIDLMLARNFQ